MRILLVEDESELANWLVRALAQSGFIADWVTEGRLVAKSLADTRYDALILDVGLPDRDGHQVLAELRRADQRLPILILTARDSLIERVSTLHEGADDFLAKPFQVPELEARLLALIRRARGSDRPRFACGPLTYDAASCQFRLHDEPLGLTPREHAVLRSLIQRSGEPLTKREILEREVPMAPLILGFVLGDLMEQNLRRALSMTDGELSILWSSPIAIGLWVLTALMVTVPPILRRMRRRTAAAPA